MTSKVLYETKETIKGTQVFKYEVSLTLERGLWFCQDNMLCRTGITSGTTPEEALERFKLKYNAFEFGEKR